MRASAEKSSCATNAAAVTNTATYLVEHFSTSHQLDSQEPLTQLKPCQTVLNRSSSVSIRLADSRARMNNQLSDAAPTRN